MNIQSQSKKYCVNLLIAFVVMLGLFNTAVSYAIASASACKGVVCIV